MIFSTIIKLNYEKRSRIALVVRISKDQRAIALFQNNDVDSILASRPVAYYIHGHFTTPQEYVI